MIIFVSALNNTRFSCRFFKMLGTDEMRAWYGSDHVSLAAERGAVGTLLISDELFRSVDYVLTLLEPIK